MPNKTEQEAFYEIHLNKYNEIMISMHARKTEPVSPVLIYDGGNHALLYRTPESSVLLDFIHTEARPFLLKATTILIAETENFEVVREYEAKCKIVKNLPIEKTSITPLLDTGKAKNIDERNLYQ